jgi:hypothetical protein
MTQDADPVVFAPQLGHWIGLTVLLHLPVSLLAAQACPDGGIADRLRAALGVLPAETLYVTRDYLPRVFPGVTFYRASKSPEAFHVPERRAAVVLTGNDTVLVLRVEDLGRVWSALGVKTLPRSSSLGSVFVDLLVQTGLLPPGPGLLRTEHDLTSDYRAFLSNQANLARIKPAFERAGSSGLETAFFVATSAGVLFYHALLTRDGHLIAAAEVISPYEPN